MEVGALDGWAPPDDVCDPMNSVASLPRFGLLTIHSFESQVELSGYPAAGVEHLVAIDRVLRSLMAAAANNILPGPSPTFGGWVVAGSSALHGVYLRPPRLEMRAPHELCLAPVGADALAPDALAELIATALPSGQVRREDRDPERYIIDFAGTTGTMTLPLRLERRPYTQGRNIADMPHVAELEEPGFVADARLPYYTGVSVTPLGSQAGLLLPVAYAEEIILRSLSALAVWPRDMRATPERVDDRAALTDDVRLLSVAEFTALRRTIEGPVKDAIGRKGDVMRRSIAGAIAEQLRNNSAPHLLPDHLRSANFPYTDEKQRLFLQAVDELFVPLTR